MNASTIPEPPLERSSSFIRVFGFVIAATVFLAFVLGQADRETVMHNWATRRCDLGVLLTSAFYKPDDYGGDANSFATENFNFCMRKYASQALGQAMQPAVKLSGQNVQNAGVTGQLLNTQRLMVTNLRDSFAGVINNFYKQYQKGVLAASITAQRLNSAMKRLEAVITAFMYIALSTYVGLMNTIEFVLFVVIVIILIIVIIFILMFFVLWPISPMLVATCVILASAGLGAAVGGAASVFCFVGDTEVSLLDGTTVKIKDLNIGQELADGGVVEGMFTFNGENTPLYDLYGVNVSGTHLVLYKGRYMEVASHPDATLTDKRAALLYCPVTSSRKVPVQCPNDRVTLFCDWEEVNDVVAEAAWAEIVERTLGVSVEQNATLPAGFGAGIDVPVVLSNGELKDTYIGAVSIGQTVMGGDGRPTRVLGIVRRKMKMERKGLLSDGVWYMGPNGKWAQGMKGASKVGEQNTLMYHLITDSGTFKIYYQGVDIVVRDATEVGIDRLRSCTPTVLRVLNDGLEITL
jgi:hypothetical protein